MALSVCEKCGTRYAPADKCPNCGGKFYHEEGDKPTPKAKAAKK